MTSSAEKKCGDHVTKAGGVTNDVADRVIGEKAELLLRGCIDDVTTVREPASKNIKVFVCSTGTGKIAD